MNACSYLLGVLYMGEEMGNINPPIDLDWPINQCLTPPKFSQIWWLTMHVGSKIVSINNHCAVAS